MNQDSSRDSAYDRWNPDEAIADALRSYPLVEPPDTLRRVVLERVEALRAATLPRFHLTWTDIAISLFGAGMAGLLLLLYATLPAPYRSFLLLKARFTLQWLLVEPLTPVVMLASAAILAGVATGIGLWILRGSVWRTATRKRLPSK